MIDRDGISGFRDFEELNRWRAWAFVMAYVTTDGHVITIIIGMNIVRLD